MQVTPQCVRASGSIAGGPGSGVDFGVRAPFHGCGPRNDRGFGRACPEGVASTLEASQPSVTFVTALWFHFPVSKPIFPVPDSSV